MKTQRKYNRENHRNNVKNSTRQVVKYGGNTKVQTRAGVLGFSDSMTAKMAGMLALSTASYLSATCTARMKNEKLVCAHCYTRKSFIYPNVRRMYEKNTDILTNHLLSEDEIPQIWHPLNICRLESLGETQNVLHALNYIMICKANPQTTFTVWTKNPGFYKTAFNTIPKPENLIIIYSSIFLNVEQSHIFNRFPFIDKIFTVYSKEYLREHPEIKINCGARSCLNCLRCYKKNTAKFIHEIVK